MSAEEIDMEVISGFDLEASIRYLTERASDVYDTIVFNTDSLYNQPAVSGHGQQSACFCGCL